MSGMTYCSSLGACKRSSSCARGNAPADEILQWLDYWRIYGPECPMYLERGFRIGAPAKPCARPRA